MSEMELTLVLAGTLLCLILCFLILLFLIYQLRAIKRHFYRHCHGQYTGKDTISTTTGPFCHRQVAGGGALTPLWPADEAELGTPPVGTARGETGG